ncbi:hypothetical protein [Nocardia terpenica]|uniref:Uncharacterized protein n=1 Tax=Nocardia terpenica TaxID=455432 RepID=A0A161XFR5_9NOCA|nr:hypothetical protein [Nocardia terpenica]KZM72278.1 hypothetical protein AWN90_37005 [Nocardia terpenica]NQE86577.1 hypothetical protein [Nocardia terpenica]
MSEDIRELPLSYVLNDVDAGAAHAWDYELRWLWTHDRHKTLAMVQSVAKSGIREPIWIRRPAGPDADSRPSMLGGNHAVAAAVALQLPTVPVRFLESDAA